MALFKRPIFEEYKALMYTISVKSALVAKLDTFFSNYKHQVYKKGEILIRADEDPSGIFFLKKGSIKEYAISRNGDEVVVNIFKAISFFPMSWAINNTPNKYFFEAITEVEVWKAPKEKVVEFVKEDKEILFDLLSRVFYGTDGLLSRMTYLMSGSAYSKLLIEIVIHARRFGVADKNGISYEVSIKENELSIHAGIARETVSRELKILKEKGLIKFQKMTLSIPNINKLEAELANNF